MLYIKRDILEKMIKHVQEEFPREACGILAGKKNKVEAFYPMRNIEDSSSSYFMEPKEQLKVMKDIRSLDLEMVGIYHSHPYAYAFPSARDIELAFYPDVSYVIISLINKTKPELKSFKIKEKEVKEEELIIVNE